MKNNVAIEVSHLKTILGGHVIHEDLDLTVNEGEIMAIVGGSGSGKSTLLRAMLLLLQPVAGTLKFFGKALKELSEKEIVELRRSWGVLFQQGALFSTLTVLENIAFPMQENTQLRPEAISELALLKIGLVGLPPTAANKYPSELSGGMIKRAALARALALDPHLLFLDEPTAGLDPEGANAFDELILELRQAMGLTVVMVTHDLDTLWRVPDRVAFLYNGKTLAVDKIDKLAKASDSTLQAYFNGPRSRGAKAAAEESE